MLSKEYFKHYKSNLRVGLPVCLSQFGHISVAIADTVMVGHLGSVPLASATLALSVCVPFMMLGIGISYGITPLVAKADGENNKEEISKILKNSLLINALSGALLVGLMYLCSYWMYEFNQPKAVTIGAIPFFKILTYSIFPLMIFQVFKQFAEGLSFTKQAMVIIWSGTVFNIALNYLLIYEPFGLPPLGANGAAIATLVTRIVMAIVMFAFVFYNSRFEEYRMYFKIVGFSKSILRKIFTISLPIGFQLSLETGAFAFAAIMVGWLGANEIAAHQIALNMAAVAYMGATGLGAAATVRVGNEFGKKDYHAMRMAGKSSFYLVIFYMSLTALFFITFRAELPYCYLNDEKVCKIATSLLLIAAFFQLSDGIQTVGLGVLRGIGDVKIPTAIALFAYWVIGLPVGYILGFKYGFGVEGIWYGLFLGLVIAAFFLFLRFERKSFRFLAKVESH